ncbi:hypothetical protein K435DRAFT_809638 [Dendrothele bispora CBS 962.96]|uniref:Uncharacterized protein n=1 Tax=Dendrothele bispora (strain CBS 962.96) TaxID=1314807 RepID=A0A4S8KXL1_DENBC|nr:hypothetical protein K435DRAFT_809638 [Dendrothele bispora CBS 962.96]
MATYGYTCNCQVYCCIWCLGNLKVGKESVKHAEIVLQDSSLVLASGWVRQIVGITHCSGRITWVSFGWKKNTLCPKGFKGSTTNPEVFCVVAVFMPASWLGSGGGACSDMSIMYRSDGELGNKLDGRIGVESEVEDELIVVILSNTTLSLLQILKYSLFNNAALTPTLTHSGSTPRDSGSKRHRLGVKSLFFDPLPLESLGVA